MKKRPIAPSIVFSSCRRRPNKTELDTGTSLGSKGKTPTRLSPFSFVIFGLNPLGRACSNMSIWPLRAASKSLPANAIASGGNCSAGAGGQGGAESISVSDKTGGMRYLDCTVIAVRQSQIDRRLNCFEGVENFCMNDYV
jgi:hypothetical protein